MSGRKTIKIDAPIMMTNDKIAVWMDQGEWAMDLNSKIKLTFVTAKDCTMFGLKYAAKNK